MEQNNFETIAWSQIEAGVAEGRRLRSEAFLKGLRAVMSGRERVAETVADAATRVAGQPSSRAT